MEYFDVQRLVTITELKLNKKKKKYTPLHYGTMELFIDHGVYK